MADITRQDTFDKVVALIAEKLSIDPKTITGSSTLHDLGADSIDLVKIVMGLEEQLDISINDEDAEHLKNVDDVVDYVHRLRTARE